MPIHGDAHHLRARKENMASFPELRPRSRSASAESRGLRSFRSLVLLTALPVVSVIAFLAVSELATLRGAAKAHAQTPAFLAHALGSPDSAVRAVRKPAP